MHWAAHGHTAAELIYARVDATKPNMGITNYPGNTLLLRDVEIAKNYLTEEELNILNRIVTAYLEVAEIQALNHIPMTMRDWMERLHQFLPMPGREVLAHAGQSATKQLCTKLVQNTTSFAPSEHSCPQPSNSILSKPKSAFCKIFQVGTGTSHETEV